MPGLQEASLHGRLPGERAHPRVPGQAGGRRFRRLPPRSCVRTTPCPPPPAGSARRSGSARAQCVRGKRGESVAIGWLERFVADWAAANMKPDAPPAREERLPRGRDRFRPRRSHRRRRTRPQGTRRSRVRGPARHRRRAALRHPRVPPSQDDRGQRGRQPACPGRGDRVRRDRGAHDHAAGHRRRVRRGVHRQRRRSPHVPERARRELEGRLLRQRVPHARQSHGRLDGRALRHSHRPRQARGGLRRRQRGHGLRAHVQAPRGRARRSSPTAGARKSCRPGSRK